MLWLRLVGDGLRWLGRAARSQVKELVVHANTRSAFKQINPLEWYLVDARRAKVEVKGVLYYGKLLCRAQDTNKDRLRCIYI